MDGGMRGRVYGKLDGLPWPGRDQTTCELTPTQVGLWWVMAEMVG